MDSAPIATAAEIRTYMGESSRRTSCATYPLPARNPRRAGRAPTICGPSRRRTRHGEDGTFTANFLWMCQGYYRHSEGYTPEWKGMERLQGPNRAPSAMAGRLDPPARRSSLSAPARPRRRLFRDRRQMRPHHHAAAFADLFPDRPQRHRNCRDVAAIASARNGSTRSCAAKSSTSGPPSPDARSPSPGKVKQELLGGIRAALGPDYESRSIHAELSAVAAAHRLYPRRRSVQGHQGGKASVVTDEIERFTKAASC